MYFHYYTSTLISILLIQVAAYKKTIKDLHRLYFVIFKIRVETFLKYNLKSINNVISIDNNNIKCFFSFTITLSHQTTKLMQRDAYDVF